VKIQPVGGVGSATNKKIELAQTHVKKWWHHCQSSGHSNATEKEGNQRAHRRNL